MSEENKAVARRYLEEVWTGDAEAIIKEVVHEDYEGHDPAAPGPQHGQGGVREFITTFKRAFPDGRVTVEELIAEGDVVAARWIGQGTHRGELMGIPPTNRQVKVTGQSQLRLRDDKVIEEWGNWDTLGMLRQVGVVS